MPAPTTLRLLHPDAGGRSENDTPSPPGRRSFLAACAAAGAGTLLAACGGGSSGSAGSGSSLEKALSIYTWGEYDAPSTTKDFAAKRGVKVTLDTYSSNEEMIAKLVAAKGTSGYDIVVPSSYYVPQMVSNGLLEPLTASLLPNLKNVAAAFRGDATMTKYVACKDWGTTGYVYDNTVVTRKLTTWTDFFDAAMHEASGKTSLLEDPGEVVAAYFNAHGIDENTTDAGAYDACKTFLVDQIAPHVQAFDSYPGSAAIPQATRALAHIWNGDARSGILASKTPQRWTWVLPSPTNRWQDNWAIAKGAPHPKAAHAFINTVLDPAVSLKELEYIGYDTGITSVADTARSSGLKLADLVFFTDAQVASMTEGKITSATPKQSKILDAVRAAAAT